MNKMTLSFGLLLLTMALSCRRVPEPPVGPTRTYTGHVFKSLCGNIAVQFTDGSTLGQVGWRDPSDSSKVYNYVFSVANPCTWGQGHGNDNIKFRFTNPTPQGCAMCLAYTPTPDTAYHIVVIK